MITEVPLLEENLDQSSQTVVIDPDDTIDSVSCTVSTPTSTVSPGKRIAEPLEKLPRKKLKNVPGKVKLSKPTENKETRKSRQQKSIEKEDGSLTKDIVWEWDPKPTVMQQIKLFFSSPCPTLIVGPSTNGTLLCGALMEYRLRELLGCEIGGELKDLVGYGDQVNYPIERAMYLFEQAKNYDDPVAVANFKQWGKMAEQFSRLWDGPLRDLYDRKPYMTAGLYADKNVALKSKVSRFYSDEDFAFPLPQEFPPDCDFDLSYDLHYMVEEIGGTAGLEGSSETEKPTKFQWIPKNIFVDRKPRKDNLPVMCDCKLTESDSVGCGSSCLNRCMYIECSENCPTGKKCSNRRFQNRTPDFTNTLKVKPFQGRGFGIEATKPIPRDAFVMEYRGEIINDDTLVKRMQTIYKFSKHHYFLNYGYLEVIDGHRKGTIARFANHSCDPNCRIEKWKVDGEYRFGIVACRNIQAGEEITYDYNFQSFGRMQKCFCGAQNCRGFIGLKKENSSSPAITAEAARKLKAQVLKGSIGSSQLSKKSTVAVKPKDPSVPKRRTNRIVYQNEESAVFHTVRADIEDHDGTFLMTYKGTLVPNEKYDSADAKECILNWSTQAVKPFLRRTLKCSKQIDGFISERKPNPKRNSEELLQYLDTLANEKDREKGVKTRRMSRK